MQKYGYEAEFDEDGFLSSYEEAWTKIHEKIAKLYEDNELTKDEQKLEEDYKVELEELNGALEDYENSLKELQADIEAYEESLYEIYDNKVEQLQHKVEFKIELNEDDLSYFDFWIEALGDSLYNALSVITTMGQKTGALFEGIDTYKQGIQDIYDLSDDPFHTWATGGLEGVLSQD
jgi:chromosome segregation ATPase